MNYAQRLWFEAASRALIEAEEKASAEKEAPKRDDDKEPPETAE